MHHVAHNTSLIVSVFLRNKPSWRCLADRVFFHCAVVGNQASWEEFHRCLSLVSTRRFWLYFGTKYYRVSPSWFEVMYTLRPFHLKNGNMEYMVSSDGDTVGKIFRSLFGFIMLAAGVNTSTPPHQIYSASEEHCTSPLTPPPPPLCHHQHRFLFQWFASLFLW